LPADQAETKIQACKVSHALHSVSIDEGTYINNGIKSGNACLLDCYNPGTRVGIARSRNEVWLIIGDDHTNQDSTQDVKEKDPISDSLCGFGNRSMRVAGFGSSDNNLEKLALIKALRKPRKCPVDPVIPAYSVQAPGVLQYLKPIRSCAGAPPRVMTKLTKTSPRKQSILMLAVMTSDSPKLRSVKRLEFSHTF
jgi:hypothetical protein